MARGVPKTMTPAALEQRRNAGFKPGKKIKKSVARGNGSAKLSANEKADKSPKHR